jgi:nucleotide-binding universal stress UspA family protein
MREIVVGVDDSTASERALDRALLEAEVSGRPLRVVHAWTTPVWIGGVPGFGYNALASSEDSERYAKELVEEILKKGLARRVSDAAVDVRTEVVEGDPGRVLVEASQEAAVVVVGGRGHGYVKSALLGSATAFVLHHASSPVMVVPDPGSPAAAFQRVVVGVDGSPASRAALRWGLEAARRQGCQLLALHAWLLTTTPGRQPMQFVPALSEYETEARDWLVGEVADALPDRHGVDVQTELQHSSAAAALMDKAGPDDLLVVGSRGRGGFASLVLGSVATQCARHARGVVVVVRAEHDRLDR